MTPEFAQMLQQQPLVDAQAELTKQKAKEQEILNNRMRSEDLTHKVEDIIAQWKKNNEGKKDAVLPDLPVVPHDSGWFKAMRERNLYQGEQQTVEIQSYENDLRRLIITNQIASPHVLDAFVNMPVAEKSKLISEAHLAVANAQLARQKKKSLLNRQSTLLLRTHICNLRNKLRMTTI